MHRSREIKNLKDQLLQANLDLIRAGKNEERNEITIEWYEAQVQELKDIRKIFWDKFGDMANGNDAYFPDLVKKQIEKLLAGNKDE